MFLLLKDYTCTILTGLDFAPTVGPCSALCQHLLGHHVLQIIDIVQAERRLTRKYRKLKFTLFSHGQFFTEILLSRFDCALIRVGRRAAPSKARSEAQ